jgi:hypothetical protein
MMPKVSGFEMLDILRTTQGIQNTRVIVMTALSQAEDKARAEKLGADMYLVKSQVTLEDMARSVRNILNQDGHSLPKPTTTETAKEENTPTAPVETPDKLETLIGQEQTREEEDKSQPEILTPDQVSSENPKDESNNQNQ